VNPRSRWEMVNAYVDGELAPTEAKSFAEQIDGDTALAAEVALVARLKACATRSLEHVDATEIHAPARRPRARWLAWAAAVAALFVAVSVVWHAGRDAGAAAPLIEHAQLAHDAFLAQAPELVDRVPGGKLESSLAYLRVSRARVPDLTPVKLRFADARLLTAGSRQGLHVGYLGPHGCRISLVIWPHPRALPLALIYYPSPRARAYAWRAATYGYVLLADPMP